MKKNKSKVGRRLEAISICRELHGIMPGRLKAIAKEIGLPSKIIRILNRA